MTDSKHPLRDQSICRWCGAPATHERTVEPEMVHPKTKKVTRAAVYATVCDQHNAMFDREERRVDLRKSIVRLESAERRGRPFNADRLEAERRELAGLEQ